MPGDKSISHRAAILSALAHGQTRIENFAPGEDCGATLRCLSQLGVRIERDDAALMIEGVGRGPGAWDFRAPDEPLDCGNSGTTMRLMTGVLAAQSFVTTLTGDASLSRRPMLRIVEPLELMGASVTTKDGHAPLIVEGRQPLEAIEYVTPVASAQLKSCVLLAGLGARGPTRVIEHEPTRDHTELMLRWFGVNVERETTAGRHESGSRIGVEGPASFDARDLIVPGDISSAAFLIAAASLLEGSELTVEGVGLNPTRAHVIDVLREMGADVHISEARMSGLEPTGDVHVRGGARDNASPTNRGACEDRGIFSLRGGAVARLIDELPLLAVVGALRAGGLEIRDAVELRVKESDRIAAIVTNLRAMGVEIEEYDDGLRVRGASRLKGARLSSFGDHRIAMACAVAALAALGESEIEGAEECVGVSFPDFFQLLDEVAVR